MTEDAAQVTAVRHAFVTAVLENPFRTRDAVLDEVAARVGASPEAVRAAIPFPGSVEWIDEFSPTAQLPELRWGRTPEQLRADVTNEDPKVRAAGLRDLLYATVPSDASRAIVLEVLATDWIVLRVDLIRSAWRHFPHGTDLRDRLRELAGAGTNHKVRIAAILRLGLDVDRDPATVTTLLESIVPGVAEDVRVAALNALANCGRGYRRAVGAVARTMLDEDVGVRVVAYEATLELVDDATQDDIARWLIDAGRERPDPAMGAIVALVRLQVRRPGFARVVLPHLSDPDPVRRRAALPLLGMLTGSDDAVIARAIVAACADEDEGVRALAAEVRRRVLARNLPNDPTRIERGHAGRLSDEVAEVLA